MTRREEITRPDSCLNKAKDDELIFVILAHDLASVAAVKAWIRKRIKLGKNKPSDPQILEAKLWCARVKQARRTSSAPKIEASAAPHSSSIYESVCAETELVDHTARKK